MDSGLAASRQSGMTAQSLLGLFLLVRLFLLAFLVLAAQRGTENVAQGGAGIRRAVLGDRLLLLGDFQRLDRDGDLMGAAVELHDAAVDLLADGEAVGPLLGAVARELGTLDEGGE